jgi:5,10-methylene-tetrahydrofolate dehydrogenase/methenyl tetrahydrofolate cyclohydrolase
VSRWPMTPPTLTYEGPPPYVGALAQMLEEEGVTVEYPPHETRDLSSALAIVAVVLTATGSARAISRLASRGELS